jgi:cytochrome-b5 reductase
LTIGQDVKIKGPKGKFMYTLVKDSSRVIQSADSISADLAPSLIMIAGGTGITPMYQIIKSSLKDPKDQTKLSLIYANVEEDDIREPLESTVVDVRS